MNIEEIVGKVYEDCGMIDPLDLKIEDVIESQRIYIKEESMDGASGRIIPSKNSAIITLDSNIGFDSRRRFVLAHELGHYVLHRDKMKVFIDDEGTLNSWYSDNYAQAEYEANMFAAEFLMPRWIFEDECKGSSFFPELIDYLSEGFEVSKTAAILRYVEYGHFPICIVYCQDNKMKWFKRSNDFRYFLNFSRDFPPPNGTVAREVFETNARYEGKERKQEIRKLDWFEPSKYDESNPVFYEYCLYVPSYNYALSVIWEE